MRQQIRSGQGVCSTSEPGRRPNMAITKTEFLNDRLRVHFFCPRPWGSDDEYSVVEVAYETIHELSPIPVDQGHGDFREVWEEAVYVPDLQVTLVFRFAKWQETDDCRMEALVGGPYLTTSQGSNRSADSPFPAV